MLEPKIIFENKDFIVVYKPHGLNSEQDKQGNPSLESWINEHTKKKTFLVHRLDRPVSGILLCAKKKTVLQYLQENWKNFNKKYIAIVEGDFPSGETFLEHYHHKDLKNFRAVISKIPKEGFQFCSLKCQKIKPIGSNSCIEVELITGKYHQIRAQLSYIGHPILGDEFYDSKKEINSNTPCIALCAYQIHFFYPSEEEKFRFEQYPIEDFWEKNLKFKI